MYFSLVVLTAFFSASFIQAEQLETLRNDVCRGIVKLAIKMRCDLVDENSILEDEVDNTEANNRAHLCDIVHLITEDDTCDSIAESHNLTLDVFNSSNVDCDNLKVGKSICLLNLNISEPESNANQTDDNSTDQEIDDSFTTQSEDETSESDNYDSDYESESDDYADESVGYTTTVKQTTTKATTTTAKPVPVMNAVNKDGLMAHNYYRRKHGVSPLQYDAGLAKYAQEWADYLAQTGTMKHRSQNKYGENLAMASGKDLTGEDASDMWYSEIKDYNFNTGKKKWFGGDIGHFTQLVWAGSQRVGFGKAIRGNRVFIVANYHPAGNVIGYYTSNVFPKTG